MGIGIFMNQDSFLRMQLITQGSNSSSFEANINKLVSVVLFDNGQRMTSSEIRQKILEEYELEFAPEEIEKALQKKNIGIVLEEESVKRQVGTVSEEIHYRYYSLEPKVYERYRKSSESNTENTIIAEFIAEHKEIYPELSIDIFKGLLHKFLYSVFNSNKETLLLLIKNQVMGGNSEEDQESQDFTNDEKHIINDFLKWNNKNKDQLIYQTVSYCVEYCLLTVKKGYSSYKDIFACKKFYLDTNVILRLAGINNEERKTVTQSFIKKCQENKIDLVYTNHTYTEIKETIHKNVDNIKNILSGHRAVDRKHWQFFSKQSTILDFIDLYNEWCRNENSNYADYAAFEKYVMRNIEDILRAFKREDYPSFETTQQKEYRALCESLMNFKTMRHASVSDKSVAIDVNNFMYIHKIRKSAYVSFSDTKEYLISTDGNLCAWGNEIMPGAVPVAVRPSVWYSLILKFKGRTDDDYKAFNLFLNLRYRVNDTKLFNLKEKVLCEVQKLDEPVELKNLILEDITDKLLAIEVDEMVELSPEALIEDATDSVIMHEAQKMFKDTEAEVISEAQKKSQVRTVMTIAETRANKKLKRYEKTKRILNWVKLVSGGVFVIALIFFFIRTKGKVGEFMTASLFGYDAEGWINLLAQIIPVCVWAVCDPLIKILEKQYTYENLLSKERKKLENDLP